MRTSGLLLIAVLAAIAACSGNEEPPPPPPTVARIVVVNSATSAPIPDAHVLIDDGRWVAIGETGTLEMELDAGSHTYRAVGGQMVTVPLPFGFVPGFTLPSNQTTEVRIELDPRGTSTATGDITGTVTKDDAPLAGALVFAPSGGVGFSDADGRYILAGVAVGGYAVTARIAGAAGASKLNVTVADGTATEGVDLALTTAAGVMVTGSITGGTGTSSVALVDPSSGYPVPGLSTLGALDGAYTISNVVPGRYRLAAAFEQDAYVLDPEPIRDSGPITIEVAAADVTQDLAVAPTIDGIAPDGIVTETAPTLSWAPFAGADYYVVEVRDAAGQKIWGGFDATGQWSERVIGATEVVYGGPALVPGPRYSFRVFAAMQNPVVASDFELIAGSEIRAGHFRIRP